MKMQLILSTLVLDLFTGAKTTTSAMASTDDIQSQSKINIDQVTEGGTNPEAIPAVVGAYSLKTAVVAGLGYVAPFPYSILLKT
ncbi:hypothetical protein IC620_12300 [Hazenella sp. IB182357]|uniref:Uncharacterized protein n=1 Tax=Polycladospora coralii TaxID=2771432 RepID=A0A926N769_9BACL|nr:hypothetical protein [Polycladospora coralii]MBD1373136.1 hypothetical protein [Polycladospora coralii]MBS7531694.1 hypothetical protein [Polycladospora coralii]